MSRPGFAVALSLSLALASTARAQILMPSSDAPGPQNIEGITVTGKGSVNARPNRLEIDLEVSAASELSADAIVKYRDARKRIEDAFNNLKLENVKVQERGLLVDNKGAAPNPYYYEPQQNQRTRTEVQLSRKLVVNCSNIRELDEDAILQLVARLLDVAQDAGGQVGPQGMNLPYYVYNYNVRPSTGLVRFVLDDFETAQDQAYEAAVADARSRAQRLARLSGVELGPVVAIREVVVPGESSASGRGGDPSSDPDDPDARRLESSKYQEIPVRVVLLVRFEVHPRAVGDAGAGGR